MACTSTRGRTCSKSFASIAASFAVVVVRDDAAARVDVLAAETAMFESIGDDPAGQALAIADDEILGARCKFTHGGYPTKDVVEFIELLMEQPCHIDNSSAHNRGRSGEVALAEIVRKGHGAGTIIAGRRVCGREELVGNLRHSRHNDDGLKPTTTATFDDRDSAMNRGPVLNRCSTKLHDHN
jgi:hypothetical protein